MNATDFFNTTMDPPFFPVYSQSVETAPVYLFCCALSLAATSSFLRAGFVLKFIAMLTCIAIQGSVLTLSQLYIVYDGGRMRCVGNILANSIFSQFARRKVTSSTFSPSRSQFPSASSHFGLATRGVFFLLLIAIVLHILDRQGDYVARTDFLWKAKLKTEQEEVETMRGINKVSTRNGRCDNRI